MLYKGGWVLASAAVFFLSGCVPGAEEPEPPPVDSVDWTPCSSDSDLDEAPDWGGDPDWLETLECGTVAVPLDHGDPEGATVGLALARQPASGRADERIGSLVLNPGGPGEPGVEMLDFPFLDDDVHAAFDVVSFDPRGVGESEGFACGDWYAMDEARRGVADPENVTDTDLAALEATARDYADSCAETVGEEFLANMGTVNVVRDLDLLREALGDEQLTYAGFSYGTHIGALYAEMFPENTRALVLDGAVETERPNVEIAAEQADAFQGTWDQFVAGCVRRGDCLFSGEDAADAEMGELLDRLDDDPPEARGMPVDGSTLLGMVSMELYYEAAWDELADTLAALGEDPEGAGPQLDRLYDNTFGQYEERDADEGERDPVPGSGELDSEAALTAVNCADRSDPTDPEVYRDTAERVAGDAPFFGPDLVWEQLPCAYWADTEEAPTGFTAPDAPPILVVGTVGDPATPYAWAEELSDQLATAALLTYEGSGHTVYGYGNPCVDEAVDAYLLEGDVPEAGHSCPPW